jgi:hypothetical protein
MTDDPRKLFAGTENLKMPVSDPPAPVCPQDSTVLTEMPGWTAQWDGPPQYLGPGTVLAAGDRLSVLGQAGEIETLGEVESLDPPSHLHNGSSPSGEK